MFKFKTSRIGRLLNTNIGRIVFIIIVFLFIFLITQVINKLMEETSKESNDRVNLISTQEQVAYETDTVIDNETAVVNKNIINSFVEYCNNGQTELAYNLLTDECKQEFYPTLESFTQYYYNKYFNTLRNYEIQAVSTETGIYTYQLYLKEDIMSTGVSGDETEITDYITIVEDNKLNLHSLINKEEINKNGESNGIKITVISKKALMDYEEYEFLVENNSENIIKLDSKESTKSTYIQNTNEINYTSFIDEMFDEDLIIEPFSTKNVTIKFNKMYNVENITSKIIFSDIVQDYEGYINRVNFNKLNIQIEL